MINVECGSERADACGSERADQDPQQHQSLGVRHPTQGFEDGGGLRWEFHSHPGEAVVDFCFNDFNNTTLGHVHDFVVYVVFLLCS